MRYSMDIRITQSSQTAAYNLTVTTLLEGRPVKTLTRRLANPERKHIDAALQVILARGVAEDLRRWANQPTLF